MKFVETETSSTWPITDYPADVSGTGETDLGGSETRSQRSGSSPVAETSPVERPAVSPEPASEPVNPAPAPSPSKRKKKAASGPSVSERLVHKRKRSKRKKSKHRIAFVLGYLAAGGALYWFGVKIYESWY